MITYFGSFDASAAAQLAATDDSIFNNSNESNQVLASGEISGAHLVFLNLLNAAPGNLTTRDASVIYKDLLAEYGFNPLTDGTFSWFLRVINNGGAQATLLGGAGVQVNGTNTIAAGAFRDFVCTLTSAQTLTIQTVGGGTV